MNNKNVEQAVSAAKEMKPPKHFLSEMLHQMVVYSLDRSDEDREHTSTLVHALCTEGMVTGEHLLQVRAVRKLLKPQLNVVSSTPELYL